MAAPPPGAEGKDSYKGRGAADAGTAEIETIGTPPRLPAHHTCGPGLSKAGRPTTRSIVTHPARAEYRNPPGFLHRKLSKHKRPGMPGKYRQNALTTGRAGWRQGEVPQGDAGDT